MVEEEAEKEKAFLRAVREEAEMAAAEGMEEERLPFRVVVVEEEAALRPLGMLLRLL